MKFDHVVSAGKLTLETWQLNQGHPKPVSINHNSICNYSSSKPMLTSCTVYISKFPNGQILFHINQGHLKPVSINHKSICNYSSSKPMLTSCTVYINMFPSG